MRRSVPWLLAGVLVAGALVLAVFGRGILSRDSDDDSSATAGTFAPSETRDGEEAATGSPPPSIRPEEPQGLSARLMSDSDGARRNMFAMTIRDAGYDCPEVRTADTLAPGGHAWRAYCGALRLYWIEIDDFGRMSVEPGAYNESDFGPDAGGGNRTITIRPEDLEQLQEVR